MTADTNLAAKRGRSSTKPFEWGQKLKTLLAAPSNSATRLVCVRICSSFSAMVTNSSWKWLLQAKWTSTPLVGSQFEIEMFDTFSSSKKPPGCANSLQLSRASRNCWRVRCMFINLQLWGVISEKEKSSIDLKREKESSNNRGAESFRRLFFKIFRGTFSFFAVFRCKTSRKREKKTRIHLSG